MERKNKIMLAAAIGAVCILVASTVVRCTAARSAAEGAAPDPDAAVVQDDPGALGILQSHAWQAEGDMGKTVQFRDGSFVESDGKGAKVTSFEVRSEKEGEGGITVIADLVSDSGATQGVCIIVSGSEGAYTVSSDSFQLAKKYVQAATPDTEFEVTGVEETYASLIGGDVEGLAGAVGAYCAAHVPTATKASFDGEVYLDVKEKHVSATFHCDDSASTVLSVTYADGAFLVLG